MLLRRKVAEVLRPDGKTHEYVGITAGAGYTAFQAKEQSAANSLVEVLAGGLGGWAGGKLPDVFEPAVSSWHRGFAHSATVGPATAFSRKELVWTVPMPVSAPLESTA